jgi:hypothetical protein
MSSHIQQAPGYCGELKRGASLKKNQWSRKLNNQNVNILILTEKLFSLPSKQKHLISKQQAIGREILSYQEDHLKLRFALCRLLMQKHQAKSYTGAHLTTLLA